MKKSTKILIVLLGLIVVGGLVYFLWSSPADADIASRSGAADQYGLKKIRNIDLVLEKLHLKKNLASQNQGKGIKPKLLSGQDLTLQEVGTDEYEVVQPIAIGGGFGIRLAYPSGLVPSDSTKWERSSDVGIVVLDKTYKNVAVYPITGGPHQINCKIANQNIVIKFSDTGYNTTTATTTMTSTTSNTVTVTPSVTITSTATVSVPVEP